MHVLQKNGELKAMLIMYIDDCMVMGPENEVKEIKEKSKREF